MKKSAALKWRIREPLDVNWKSELLLLDAKSGPGKDSLKAVAAGGKAFPAQYDRAAGAYAVFADIEAGADITLEPASGAPGGPAASVETRDSVHVLSNRWMKVYAPKDVVARDAGDRWEFSGPIAGIVGPDGVRRCGSRITLAKSQFFEHDRESIRRADPAAAAREEEEPTVAVRVTAAGPVFCRCEYDVQLPGGRGCSIRLTLYSDWPALFVDERLDAGREGHFELDLSGDFNCDQYFFGGIRQGKGHRFVPVPRGPYRIGSLAPHHTQEHVAYPWLGFMRSDAPQGDFRGIMDTEVAQYADTITIMAHKPWEWDYPGETTLRFEADEGMRVTARGALARGTRRWCLFAVHRDEVLHRRANPIIGDTAPWLSMFARWHRKINDVPFDWVRRLDLDSGMVVKKGYQASLLPKAEWAAWKSKMAGPLGAALGERLNKNQDDSALHLRWALYDDRQALARLAVVVKNLVDAKVNACLDTGFLSDYMSAVANRALGPAAVYYEACVEGGALDEKQEAHIRKRLLFLAHASATDAMFPSHHNYLHPSHPRSVRNWAVEEKYSTQLGTLNFQTDVYFNLILMGAVFGGHPKSGEWLKEGAAQMESQLGFHFHPGGVYAESIGYFAHMFHNMLMMASILKRKGVRDFYADGRFRDAIGCLADYLGAPRRPALEKRMGYAPAGDNSLKRHWPAAGDTGHECVEAGLESFTAVAAWEVREHDRTLSDRLLSAWVECGKPVWTGYAPRFDLFYHGGLDPKAGKFVPETRRFMNVGCMMRADVGKPSETSIFLRSGSAGHHWGFDHGHFTLTTRGAQLVPDFGYHGHTAPGGDVKLAGYHTWLHNVVTFGPFDSAYKGVEKRGSEPAVKLGGDFDYVVVDAGMNMIQERVWRNFKPCIYVEYYRHFLFARNRYVFVWDRIPWSVYPSQLRINCLADSVACKGNRIKFAGIDGVDMVVNVLEPAGTGLFEGVVGNQRYVLLRQDCQMDYIWTCQSLGPGEPEFKVQGGGNMVCIKGADLHGNKFEDFIVLGRGDAGAEVKIGGKTWKLDGRLAILRREGGRDNVHLLDATSLE